MLEDHISTNLSLYLHVQYHIKNQQNQDNLFLHLSIPYATKKQDLVKMDAKLVEDLPFNLNLILVGQNHIKNIFCFVLKRLLNDMFCLV